MRLIPTIGLALAAACCHQARADFITGTVDFVGTATINGTGPLNATAFTGFSGVNVDVGTGNYSGTGGTSVTVRPFSFKPATGSISSLWSFTVGGKTFSFDVTSMNLDFQGMPTDGPGLGDIRVSGTGVAHATGFQDTPASWVLHASGNQTEIELAMGSTTTSLPPPHRVPDSGSTMALLAGALSGVSWLRRRIA